MQNLYNDLKELLAQDERFLTDGKLLKNTIVEKALQLDPSLIEILLTHERLKQHFFETVGSVTVFDKIKFQRFVMNKLFLPDSYTNYKNKIGLITTEDRDYLTESNEVVLAWPYKDCLLEGGQKKDDDRRNEIFWNETLAADQIDRLLSPKIFTNFKQYSANGQQTPTSIDPQTDNLLIKGNNLLVLHSLLHTYRGKVKLIYIDPPYNTGNDSFNYNDSFNHSTWLTFMKNRLEVAKQLLSEEGVIFVQCDDNEHAYLKVLMDQVFKSGKFQADITVIVKPEGRNYGNIAKTHESILAYTTSPFTELNEIGDENYRFPYIDTYGGYDMKDLTNGNTSFHKGNRPNLYYPIYAQLNECDGNDFYRISLQSGENNFEILPKKSGNIQLVWRWGKDKVNNELQNVFAKKLNNGTWSVFQKTRKATSKPKSFWNEKMFYTAKGNQQASNLFDEKVFSNPKPEHLIARIIEIATNSNDLVLDFFVGSGTTAAVAHKMGRRFIGIEQMDYVENITTERLKKVVAGEQGGISKSVNWQGGGSFLYCELLAHNQQYLDQIMLADCTETLLQIWARMQEQAFLSYRVAGKSDMLNTTDFAQLPFSEQQQVLLALLDKNMLYVPYSEIDDSTWGVSDADKALNRAFYGS